MYAEKGEEERGGGDGEKTPAPQKSGSDSLNSLQWRLLHVHTQARSVAASHCACMCVFCGAALIAAGPAGHRLPAWMRRSAGELQPADSASPAGALAWSAAARRPGVLS